MFSFLKRLFRKTPEAVTSQQWSGSGFVDAYRRVQEPKPAELMQQLKNTAWACVSINSAICASRPPTLYVTTQDSDPKPKCHTKTLSPEREQELRSSPKIASRHRKAMKIEEVIDHPLITLLEQVNPVHNSFDLWELTTLYQEVHGSAYWQIETNSLGLPSAIWILPSQNVTPVRSQGSSQIVDYYSYRTGCAEKRFTPQEIIHFRYPDPREPYTGGLSPLRACYEQVALTSDYAAMKKAIYDNRALPSVIVSPDEVIGEEELSRLESQWNQKFRRGGTGRALFAESAMKVNVLQQSMGDLAQLAEIRATMEDICNAFSVPIAYMTTNVNMANLQAAERQHMTNCIHPRLTRRDEKLNEQLIPLYDTTGRLFLASENPIPEDMLKETKRLEMLLTHYVLTINEVRKREGLKPVAWGDKPFKPETVQRIETDDREVM